MNGGKKNEGRTYVNITTITCIYSNGRQIAVNF